jgi:hypothetical protein
MTQRRMALVLGVNRKTIVRKFRFAAKAARAAHERWLSSLKESPSKIQLDEMETFEHTRLKPVTLVLAVNEETGAILDVKAAPLHYKGRLAGLAFAKYGPRPDRSPTALHQVLKTIQRVANPQLTITTDGNARYPRTIRKTLPNATHRSYYPNPNSEPTFRPNLNDPLFTLNHTAAKIRHDLSRMARKTWVTTKKISRLQQHIDLYIAWNNRYNFG